ncbi:MAG: DUF86 domain-containing protein [Minisyncoccia bacterium]
MTKGSRIFLEHILESIGLIEVRTESVSFEAFAQSIDLQDMVLRRLEIIGEAVRKLPREFRDAHEAIDWSKPADMRSVLIHGYFDVNLEIVWNTIHTDLPPFKKAVQDLLKDLAHD